MKFPKYLIATAVGALSIALAAPPALAKKPSATPQVAATAPTPAPAPRKGTPALWKVADQDTTIYLFGTVHLLAKDVSWFEPDIAPALQSADELVTEVDLANTSAKPELLLAKASLPAGENLRALLPPENRQSLEQALGTLGLPAGTFDGQKPWFAALNLTILPLLAAGYDMNSGVEVVLDRNAPSRTKRSALETMEFQLDLFDSLPQDLQIAYLGQVSAAVPETKRQLDEMVDAWLAGDADRLASLMNSQEVDPVVFEKLVTSRNKNWTNWIVKRLEQPGTVFMAVGAGHLAGPGSVQDQLSTLGIVSARVK
ncbi:hypothetical protein NT2_06_00490 [Caenibius tardaugens NBRC 16725]|uniref:TraB/GumN family protein n=1 Tax=Caenibius tardaugens NBRC 16725 TaxID=1219035 RepID=U2YLQ4_9SPHN|nr:TraB/GumN family protein [Caenibius tardaugens]AZI37817.1 TraB/GumN family protein [Caenibius tardaugens NBRC 16725]GAD49610.1 hypothetical protein NT2_06_00490 [Caenibius tardaugens NBRC 16725]